MSGERVGFTGAEALELPGWRHVYSGKVRDLYEPADAEPGRRRFDAARFLRLLRGRSILFVGDSLASSHVVVDVAVWPQSYQAQGGEGTDDDEDDDQRDLSWPKWSGASRIGIARMWYGMGLMMCRGVAVQMTVCHVGLIPCGRGLVACGGAGTLVPHTYQSPRCDKNGRVSNCSTCDENVGVVRHTRSVCMTRPGCFADP